MDYTPEKIAEFFDASVEHVEEARAEFERAQHNLAAARTYAPAGSFFIADAVETFRSKAHVYASTLAEHAKTVIAYADSRLK